MGLLVGDIGCTGRSGLPLKSKGGLPLESLPRTTATVYGYWREADELLDDEQKWHGSALIVAEKEDVLLLVTNSHCLGLAELAQGDPFTDNVPEVAEYRIRVEIGGVVADAEVIAETPVPIDVAVLGVPTSSLSSADYLVAPFADVSLIETGTEVAAVGSPLDPDLLEGTTTFGRVSAIRDDDSGCPLIQHDAPLNPGNSGGPLFAKLDPNKDEWYCVGVNFAKAREGEGIGFAWAIRQALKCEYEFAPCSPEGAVELIRRIYSRRAVLAP